MTLNTGFLTLIRREIYRFVSVFKQTIFPPVISSVLYFFVFGYSLGSRIPAIHGVPYMTFLIPGFMMMTVIESSYANTSSSLFISRWANNIEEWLVTPLSYTEMVISILIGGLVRSAVISVSVYGISLLFVHTPITHPALMLFFVVFVSLIFSSLGIIVALFAEEFEHLSVATTFFITPLIYLGGVFHSIDMVPPAIQPWTRLNPMFFMINGIRHAMLGVSDVPVAHSLMVVLVLFTVLFSSAVTLFRIGFKLRK
ncbi:MAG: ABC transporter permease [Candidatus Omnitrophica bacterium]|nr:ABC transporter permease [Candidatus Omnitrophota bacterium]